MQFRSTLARLHTYRRDLIPLGHYVILLTAMTAVTLLKVVIPLAVASFISDSLSTKTVSPVSALPLLVLFLLEFCLSKFSAHWNYKLSNESMVNLQAGVLERLLKAHWSAVKDFDSAYLTQRINNDSVTVADTLVEQFPAFVLDMVKVVLCLGALLVLSPTLCIIGFGAVLIFYSGYAAYRHRYQALNHAMIEAQADYFKTLSGQLGQGLLIRMNNWGRAALARFKAAGHDFVSKSLRFLDIDFAISNVGSLVARAASISFILAFGIAGSSAITIASIVSGLMLLEVLISGCQGTLSSGKSMARFLVAEKRLDQLRELPAEFVGQLEIGNIDSIILDNVSFGFEGSPLFSEISLDLRPGIHCISGPNGTGKSTLLYLIAGIYQPTGGDIQVGGVPLSSVDIQRLRGQSLGYVEQSSYLFQGTVYENLTFGNSREELAGELKSLLENVLDFVPRLPNGLDTDVGVDGKNLSGGQRQRISIARAVLKHPQVLLMDEPTAALDASGCAALIELLGLLQNETIIILVTHDRELLSRFAPTLSF